MDDSSTVDIPSSNTIDDFTDNPIASQSMAAVLKRLQTCDTYQLKSLYNTFGISEYRRKGILMKMVQDHLCQHPSLLSPNGTIPFQLLLSHGGDKLKLLTINSLEQLDRDQVWTFSDICGIPYDFTKVEFVDMIKNKLLDSASPLVEEGGMVNLKFTPKPSKQETSDISNTPIHINRLETFSRTQLAAFCKIFGVSNAKSKSQLEKEIRFYLRSHLFYISKQGELIPGNKKPLSSNSNKMTLSKPVYIRSLDAAIFDDFWALCRSYGISNYMSKEQLLERFKSYLSEHPETVRADGTIDLVALAYAKLHTRNWGKR
ncbi:hypothetical protein BASA83_003096 [Batrachochytrium salamandrivorans]|nr:hypothetical protein BASA83_003096 [Batrachochytrium salamandrivorans]